MEPENKKTEINNNDVEVQSCSKCIHIYYNDFENQYDCRLGWLAKLVTDDIDLENKCIDFEKY